MERLSFAELFQKYLRGKATPAEVSQLRYFVQDKALTAEFEALLEQAYTNKDLQVPDPEYMEEAWELFKEQQSPQKAKVVFYRSFLFRAAAVLLIILTAGTWYFYDFSTKRSENPMLATDTADIKAGSDKATLTLADGTVIVLDTTRKGNLTHQGATQVLVLNTGLLAYKKQAGEAGEIMYNTIRTPNGGKYQVMLPDGSTVWLNAASSVRFPTTFGKERMVEVSGEVYFEVAASASAPFLVKTKDAVIQVLGTSFNINDYGDKGWAETTLIDGSLRVCGNDGSPKGDIRNAVQLQPGQQARVKIARSGDHNTYQPAEISTVKADIDKVMSWHRGLFNFEDETLENVMRQLARWYDINVVYESKAPAIVFGGELSRDISLAGILKALEDSRVRFRIEDRKIIVLNN